jgi:glutathione S-transferase
VTAHSELLVLAGSHYCERVLWAFEVKALPVTVTVLAPGPHVLRLRRTAPQLLATTLPVWHRPPGHVQGSDNILDALGFAVLQRDAETALVQCIGPRVRQVFYAGLCQQPTLAAAWVARAYATAPLWLGRATALAPRLVLRALLVREGARPADRAACLQELHAQAAALSDVAEAELAALAAAPSAALSRFTLTCGALLGPLLMPTPPPWPAALLPGVRALQDLALWRLAHAAWQHRQQTALAKCPDQGGSASAQPQSQQTPARGPAAGGQGSA